MKPRTVALIVFCVGFFHWMLAPYVYIGWGGDFQVYLDGPSNPNYLYASWTSIYFEPFRRMDYGWAWLTWFSLNLAACMTLASLITKRITHGWILALCFIPVYHWCLGTGNVIPLLAVLCLTPLGCLLGISLKLYLVAFLPLLAFREGLFSRLTADVPQVRTALRLDRSAHHSGEEA